MGDVRDFLLPDLGEGLEEGEIVEWRVEAGDQVELNQIIAVVETAKAAVEIPSPFAGRVVECLGEVGETLAVGSPMVRIDVEAVTPAEDVSPEPAAEAQPAGRQVAGALDADEEPQPLVGYGQSKTAASRRQRRKAAAGGNGQAGGDRPLAKPPVRKLAKDLGVDLAAIAPGSGPDGIVTREDVRAAAEAPARAPEPTTPVAGEKAVPGFRGRKPGDVEPIRGVRKRIVEKMTVSRGEIPHAAAEQDADVTELWELRHSLTETARAEGFDVKVTPLVLVLRATVLALRRFPSLNAAIDTSAGEIRYLEPIHLGFAADTDRGLIVPVIRDAHALSTLQLALELARLAVAARDGTIAPGDLTGGTFTVSNYGGFGNDDGDPIINHPEAAILGVGAMRERPWVVDGEVRVRRVARLKLVFDHRIADGGEAGRFVASLADMLADPARMLLHA